MRGLSEAERRSEKLRSWTFLGLLADDVALATYRYPVVTASQRKAVESLLALVSPSVESTTRRPVIPRRRSMSDPHMILHEAAVLAQGGDEGSTDFSPDDFAFIRGPLNDLLDSQANDDAVRIVRSFADILAQVTLSMSEQVANEKGATEWTPQASPFSLA